MPALRHRAAVIAAGLAGDERALEIGCGQGVATALLLQHLPRGHLVVVDRSPKMIAAVETAHPGAIAERRLETYAAPIEALSLGAAGFDRILAVNLDFERRLPGSWAPLLTRMLAPSGHIVLAFEAPPGSEKASAIAAAASRSLAATGLDARVQRQSEGSQTVELVLAGRALD